MICPTGGAKYFSPADWTGGQIRQDESRVCSQEQNGLATGRCAASVNGPKDVTFRFACLQSRFPSARLCDCSVCFHNGIVQGPAGNRAYAIEAGKDVGISSGIWRLLSQRGLELTAETLKAVRIQLAKMNLIPVDCETRCTIKHRWPFADEIRPSPVCRH
jgi:hypothetical protein